MSIHEKGPFVHTVWVGEHDATPFVWKIIQQEINKRNREKRGVMKYVEDALRQQLLSLNTFTQAILYATINTMLDLSDRPEIQDHLRKLSSQDKELASKKFFIASLRETESRAKIPTQWIEVSQLYTLWETLGKPGSELVLSRAKKRISISRAIETYGNSWMFLKTKGEDEDSFWASFGPRWLSVHKKIATQDSKNRKKSLREKIEPPKTTQAERPIPTLKERVVLTPQIKEQLSVLRTARPTEYCVLRIQTILGDVKYLESRDVFWGKTVRNDIRKDLAERMLYETFPSVNEKERDRLMSVWELRQFEGVPGITKKKLLRYLAKLFPESYGAAKTPSPKKRRERPVKPVKKIRRIPHRPLLQLAPEFGLPYFPPRKGSGRATTHLQKHRELWKTDEYLKKQKFHEEARLKKLEQKLKRKRLRK